MTFFFPLVTHKLHCYTVSTIKLFCSHQPAEIHLWAPMGMFIYKTRWKILIFLHFYNHIYIRKLIVDCFVVFFSPNYCVTLETGSKTMINHRTRKTTFTRLFYRLRSKINIKITTRDTGFIICFFLFFFFF